MNLFTWGIDEHCRFTVLCFSFFFFDVGPDQTHLITAATLQHTVSFLFTRAHL
jgi:hypothetical protein